MSSEVVRQAEDDQPGRYDWVWSRRDLNMPEKFILIVLDFFETPNAEFPLTRDLISRRTAIPRKKLDRLLVGLERRGILRCVAEPTQPFTGGVRERFDILIDRTNPSDREA